MSTLNIGLDEGIMLEHDHVRWIVKSENMDVSSGKLILTNKRMLFTYQKSNGLFKKAAAMLVEIPLDEIKVICGQVLAKQVKNSEYGLHLEIQTAKGKELFIFQESARKVTPQWAAEIQRMILGDEAFGKNERKRKSRIGIMEMASSLMGTANSAMQPVYSVNKQAQASVEEQNMQSREPLQNIYKMVENQMSGISRNQNTASVETVCEQPRAYEDQRTPPPVSPPIRKVAFCSNCGCKIKDGTRFCQECGALIKQQEEG